MGGPARPLRLVLFGASVVSDWGNPAATTWRALLRALAAAGHDAVFLEPRHNGPTVGLLRARGASAVRAVADRLPDLRYRTYDLPAGLERSVWFGREVATADAALVADEAPAGLIEELAAYRTPRLVSLVHVSGEPARPLVGRFDLVLAPLGTGPPGALPLGPCVMPDPAANATGIGRDGLVVVAYGDAEVARLAAERLAPARPTLVSAGDVAGSGWAFVPEVELGELYRRSRLAVVVPGDGGPLGGARALLPLANGCPAVALGDPGAPLLGEDAGVPTLAPAEIGPDLLDRAAALTSSVPRAYRADDQASGLVRLIAQVLGEHRGRTISAPDGR